MSSIRVEFVPVQLYNLGYFGFDHLQLVFADDATNRYAQDNWLVIEALQSGSIFGGTLSFFGQDGGLRLSSANGSRGEELIDEIGTPEDRGSRVIYNGVDAFNVWSSIAAYADDIGRQKYPYFAYALPASPTPVVNSTSAIASILFWAGLDLSASQPYGLRFSPGGTTLLGLTRDDDITANSRFSTILSGQGEDQLRGYDNLFIIERLYGGLDDDVFYWSSGANIKHGGQPNVPYVQDGIDTVDYSGVGIVTISGVNHSVEHRIPDYIATYSNGSDMLFSIERISWDRANDVVIAGENVELIEEPSLFDLRGSNSGNGDQFDVSASSQPLIINAVNDTTISIQTIANEGLDAGYWVQWTEHLIGSDEDDMIHTGPTIRVVEGGEGNDLIDGRLALALSEESPMGADIDIYGGDGDDIIVSGAGITYAEGGAGSDTFVVSASSLHEDYVEFIIADADTNDSLYIPLDLYQEETGTFEGSELLQVSGGPFTFDENTTEARFEWLLPGDDFRAFVGDIRYTMDGSDLLVLIYQGMYEEFIDPGAPELPPQYGFVGFGHTETVVRVVDWQDGDLGITFPLTFEFEVFDEVGGLFTEYPGYTEVVEAAFSADRFLPALETRPDAHIPFEIASLIADSPPITTASLTANSASVATASLLADTGPVTVGGDGDDVLFADSGGPYTFSGGAGDDDITGSAGGDVIDGGTGADVMRGGRGNDTYIVDNLSDQVIEDARGGFDRLISSIDWTLGDHVEHLRLVDEAVSGTGNALRNTIEGNDANNILDGGDGNDTLVGGRGDDTLQGGVGSDGYVYELGEGNDVIIDSAGENGDRNVLILTGDLTETDIVFTRDNEASDDLVLRFSDGGSIRLVGQRSGDGVDNISFANGNTLDRTTLDTRAATAAITTNSAPVAQSDLFALAWLPRLTIPLAVLLGNDTDVNADPLSVTEIFDIQGATGMLDGEGNVVFDLAPYSDGNVISFQYTINDGQGATSVAGVDIAILPPAIPRNTPPIAQNDMGFTTLANLPLVIAANDLLANDTDEDDDPLSITAVTDGVGGSVALQNDGTILFTATPDFSGEASFTYTVADPDGDTSTASVVVAVTAPPSNEAPVVETASLGTVVEDRPAYGFIAATDPDGDTLTFRISDSNGPERGSVNLNADGTFIYTPNADANGPDDFTVLIDDGNGGITEQAFDFSILPRNDRPEASDDAGFVTSRGQRLTIRAEDLLANDFDVDGDDLSIVSVFGSFGLFGFGGFARLNNEGDVVYRPWSFYRGEASFTYVISDGHGGFDTAQASVMIV